MSFDQPTMPYHDLESGAPDVGGSNVDGGEPPTTEFVPGEYSPEGVAFDDPDSEWIIEDHRKDVRLRIPTAVLVVLLIAASGFWGGAALQKQHSKTSATTGAAAARAALAAAGGTARGGFAGATAGGFAGTGGTGTTAAAATTGLLTEVQGNTVYVTDATGALVKVTVSATTTITRSSNSVTDGLQIGDTVIVRGAKAADGTVIATAIIATAAGVQALGAGQSATGGAGGAGRSQGGAGGASGAGG